MNHSAGPWKVTEVKTSVGRAFKINRVDHSAGSEVITCIYDDNNSTQNKISHEEHKANAHLIAACPDMLVCLGDVLEWMKTGKIDGVGFDEQQVIGSIETVLVKSGENI